MPILLFAAFAPPAAAQTGEPWQPPTLTTTRFDEDWSKLADPAARTGRWTEPFKYMPVGGDAYLTIGTELRLRNEAYRNNQWGGGPAPDDGYLWVRFIAQADLHIGRVRAFVQPIAACAVGVRPQAGPIDQTRLDLLQGFADVRLGDAATGDAAGTGVTLRAGRQMLSLGTERLVGTRYGPNVALAFDGFRALASLGGATLSVFAVRPVRPGLGTFDDRRSRDQSLWGGAHVTAYLRSEADVALLRRLSVCAVAVGELTAADGEPYDLILEGVGGPLLGHALSLLAPRGVCVQFSDASGDELTTFDARAFRLGPGDLYGGTTLYGFFLGEELTRPGAPSAGSILADLASRLSEGTLDPVINQRGSWRDVDEVSRALMARRFKGKAVD